MSFGETESSMSLPSREDSAPPAGSDRWNLASTTFPDAGPMVRIHFPPAESQVRTCLSREFAFLRREAAVFRGVRAGASGAVGRDAPDAATSGLTGGNISVGLYSSTAPPVMWAA